ncbi:MAG TPA: 3'-5' exonuclease [Candidatus Sulfotelmatobacter sp.]|jgi:DNA polymerase-3 subunit epsilon|nr:3'-5' exonuclease [Candidatus Sulfotelmatobacter sp.]
MQVIAIDFETANSRRASACALGVARLQGGELSEVAEHLIRPREMHFQGINISIHGIRPEDVMDSPEFPEVWEDVIPQDGPLFLLAHNAPFDMSVLRASLDLYGMRPPEADYLCTVSVARALWRDLPNHKLSTVSAFLGIRLNHHQAGSDAEACARIALEAMRQTETRSPRQLAAKLGLAVRPLA